MGNEYITRLSVDYSPYPGPSHSPGEMNEIIKEAGYPGYGVRKAYLRSTGILCPRKIDKHRAPLDILFI